MQLTEQQDFISCEPDAMDHRIFKLWNVPYFDLDAVYTTQEIPGAVVIMSDLESLTLSFYHTESWTTGSQVHKKNYTDSAGWPTCTHTS